jgi:3-oxoadipate enol-lactonase
MNPPPTPNAPLSRLTASDGVTLAFRAQGLAPGRPVLALVHSLAMDHRFWDPMVHALAGRCAVVALDARGHGGSGRAPSPLTAARMAQDLREVIDHLGLPPVVVGGASMGGCVALQFAADHPTRTLGLALLDTTAWYGPTAAADWEQRACKARDGGLASLTAFQQTRWFSDAFRQARPDVVQACMDCFLANDLEGYMAACRMLGAFDGRSLLARIRVPTLVLVGEEDQAAPVAMARALHAGITGSTLEVVPATRHLTPLEVPGLVADRLADLCVKAVSAPRGTPRY